uniref:Glyoxalase/bleomycin resistance protein/dioxygenase n=1 Tax=Caulobacter sp. (strain K31) TaxID=366602 RepID=B0T6N7_CAUSK
MRGVRLDHATINTNTLEDTIAFYSHFLNLTPGWRPDFGFPGAWLYPADGDYAIVHLIQTAPADQGGMFDHVAFRGENLPAYLAKLDARGGWFQAQAVPGTPFTQVHHYDPNGVKIEVAFEEPLDQSSPTWGE